MTLLHPAIAIAGALAVGIPILIHLLLRRRRKPVMWGAMRFLLEAYRQQRRRLRLEQFLLLAARCLVILLAAMAIARPLLGGAGALGAGTARTVYLLLDNSVAAGLREGDAIALDRHKREAAALLASLGPSDRAALITLASPAQSVVVPASGDIPAVQSLVERAPLSEARADLAGALERVRADLDSRPDDETSVAQVVVLSDFLAGAADASRPLPAAFEEVKGVTLLASPPRESAPTNVQILSIEPLRPVLIADESVGMGGGQVRVRLRRTGPGVGEAGATTVRLRFEDDDASGLAPAAEAQVRWAPGQSEAEAVAQLDQRTGEGDASSAVLVAEIDRDALEADNIRRRPMPRREAIRVGVAARAVFGRPASVDRLTPAQWLRMALRPTARTPIDLLDIEPTAIDPASLAGLDALLLPRPDLLEADAWRRVRSFADAGGLVVVFPPAETRVHLWADEMVGALGLDWRLAREAGAPSSPTLSEETPETPLFALLEGELGDLLRPVRVERALLVESEVAAQAALLRLDDGAPWAVVGVPGEADTPRERDDRAWSEGRGRVVYIASAPTLSWTNLPAMPLMVPLMQELVRQGVGGGMDARAIVAGDAPQAPRRAVVMRPLRDGLDPLAVGSGGALPPMRHAGLYRALDEAGGVRGVVAVNADAEGARTDPQARSTIESWLTGTGVAGGGLRWLEPERAGADGAGALNESGRRSGLSMWLFAAALGVALIETLLARLFSHAKRSGERAPARPGPHAHAQEVAA